MVIVTVTYIMMVVLIGLGGFLIYEGISYIKMKEKNPDIPSTIYAASTLAFVVGIMDILFGVAHYWFIPGNEPPKMLSFLKMNEDKISSSSEVIEQYRS